MIPDNEAYYSAEIAPLLAQIARKATARNLPILVVAEYAPGQIEETRSAYRGASFPFVFTQAALQARGNIDAFVTSVLAFCKEQGVSTASSIVARLMADEKRQ